MENKYFKLDYTNELKKELENCLKKAGKDLYLLDRDLIQTKTDTGINIHAYERSICFRFGVYLDKYINSSHILKKYDLDAEYNRNIDDIKRLPNRPNGCYPDFIVHKRGSNKSNLLVIECKGWWSFKHDMEDDKIKIMDFIESPVYNYLFGLLLVFERDSIQFNWIERQEKEINNT